MDILFNRTLPPLRRDLEIMPIQHEGQPMLLLSDVFGLRQETAAISPGVLMIASLFDGQRKSNDVQALLAKEKVILSPEEIEKVADQLIKLRLLETEDVAVLRQKAFQAFRESSVRKLPPHRRGLPENSLEVSALLGRFYTDPKGPGETPASDASGDPPLGAICPHIDFFRGGPLYAWAYGELSKQRPPDVVVAIGVAHQSPNSPWVLTRKSYETPFGPMEVDQNLYEKVRAALWYDPLDEEWVHAKEHSLEFQAVWLKYIWRTDTPSWLPILCSAYERFSSDKSPSSVKTVEDAIQKIGDILADLQKQGKRVLILAGIDLAHVGRRFGDDMDITPELQKKIEEHDKKSLESALKLDADSFFLSGVGDGAWRKVCGLSALYTSLRWMRALSNGKPLQGKLLAYDQAPDPADGIVSFASAIFK